MGYTKSCKFFPFMKQSTENLCWELFSFAQCLNLQNKGPYKVLQVLFIHDIVRASKLKKCANSFFVLHISWICQKKGYSKSCKFFQFIKFGACPVMKLSKQANWKLFRGLYKVLHDSSIQIKLKRHLRNFFNC